MKMVMQIFSLVCGRMLRMVWGSEFSVEGAQYDAVFFRTGQGPWTDMTQLVSVRGFFLASFSILERVFLASFEKQALAMWPVLPDAWQTISWKEQVFLL